jgi:hypothetical protein
MLLASCDSQRETSAPEAALAAPPPPQPSHDSAEASAPPAHLSPEGGCPDDAQGSVRQIDATHCEVAKAVFFGDNQCLLSQPKLSQVIEGGRAIGVRHHDVRSRSVCALCGIRSGDVWTRLNGATLDTPDAVLALYPTLRQQDKLRIDLLREGRPHTIEIQLRE